MRNIALQTIVKERLYSLQISKSSDVLADCFTKWKSPSYVYNLFAENPGALTFYQVDKQAAVAAVLEEAEQFFLDLLNIANGNFGISSLDNFIFQPLHKTHDFSIPILETKAYGKENNISFLRLYAIRLSDGCYIVIGGLIKTTQALQDSKEGRAILNRFKELTAFLTSKNLYDAFDIGILIP